MTRPVQLLAEALLNKVPLTRDIISKAANLYLDANQRAQQLGFADDDLVREVMVSEAILRQNFYGYLLSKDSKLPRGGAVLDVGSGGGLCSGSIRAFALGSGRSYFACEPDQETREVSIAEGFLNNEEVMPNGFGTGLNAVPAAQVASLLFSSCLQVGSSSDNRDDELLESYLENGVKCLVPGGKWKIALNRDDTDRTSSIVGCLNNLGCEVEADNIEEIFGGVIIEATNTSQRRQTPEELQQIRNLYSKLHPAVERFFSAGNAKLSQSSAEALLSKTVRGHCQH